MTLRELQDAYAAGEAVVKVDDAEPWLLLKVSRATFYRSMAAGQVDGVLSLGRRRLLLLEPFLRQLHALPHECKGGCHELSA